MAGMASRSWADEEGSDEETVFMPLEAKAAGKGGSTHGSPEAVHVRHYPVMYTHHKSTYERTLYDVEGCLLLHEDKTRLNVWTAKMKDALESKALRCVHVPGRPGYRFFVTSEKQKQDFIRYRDQGWAPYRADFHVYDDEPGVVILAKNQKANSYHATMANQYAYG